MAEPLLNKTCGSVAAGSNRTFVGVVNFRVCADAAAAAAAAASDAESACAASTVACWMRSTATSVDDGRFPPSGTSSGSTSGSTTGGGNSLCFKDLAGPGASMLGVVMRSLLLDEYTVKGFGVERGEGTQWYSSPNDAAS